MILPARGRFVQLHPFNRQFRLLLPRTLYPILNSNPGPGPESANTFCMPGSLTKDEILLQLEEAGKLFANECSSVDDDIFFRQPAEKWSIAQNLTHLITSADMTRLAYRLPKFVVRAYSGKPNRASRSYDELVSKYKTKLEKGGKASGRFVAKPVSRDKGKLKLVSDFSRAMEKLSRSMKNNWSDEQLDNYLAPHPLLGKLTLRELGYFTIYHTYHHLAIIRQRMAERH